MPKTSVGTCTACGYTGPCWTYLGPQYEPPAPDPIFHWWNCPGCHTSKVSGSAHHPPPPDTERSPR